MLAAPDSGGKKVRMRPAPGEVLHFSEDPTITRFVPHGDKVTTSTLGHSGIRLHNAKPRP